MRRIQKIRGVAKSGQVAAWAATRYGEFPDAPRGPALRTGQRDLLIYQLLTVNEDDATRVEGRGW